jgi:hypothetical protein
MSDIQSRCTELFGLMKTLDSLKHLPTSERREMLIQEISNQLNPSQVVKSDEMLPNPQFSDLYWKEYASFLEKKFIEDPTLLDLTIKDFQARRKLVS